MGCVFISLPLEHLSLSFCNLVRAVIGFRDPKNINLTLWYYFSISVSIVLLVDTILCCVGKIVMSCFAERQVGRKKRGTLQPVVQAIDTQRTLTTIHCETVTFCVKLSSSLYGGRGVICRTLGPIKTSERCPFFHFNIKIQKSTSSAFLEPSKTSIQPAVFELNV